MGIGDIERYHGSSSSVYSDWGVFAKATADTVNTSGTAIRADYVPESVTLSLLPIAEHVLSIQTRKQEQSIATFYPVDLDSTSMSYQNPRIMLSLREPFSLTTSMSNSA
ncbi:hypothetical protein ACHAP3_005470 [Botrytis cinerea]